MGNIIILNGSPRAARSNSKRYAGLFSRYFPGTTAYFDITKNNHQELCARIGGFSNLLLVFPLYADAVPVTLLNFLKSLEGAPPQNRPTVSVLINCGFLEPHQNDIAVQMVRLFCKRNRYPFGSVLKIGSGEAILDSPFWILAARKIKRFSRAVAREEHRTLQITMPLTKRLFVRASTQYWRQYGEKYGTTKEQMETLKIE